MAINTISCSAGQALTVLKAMWDAQSGRAMPPMSTMMWGKPGIGKTQVAEALARYIGGKLYDVRLTTIDTSDLRGLPYYDHDTKQTMWYRPEDLPKDDQPAVLFLDELSSAQPHIQPTVYGLLQERRVGQHLIPDNVIIIAAGNGITDGAVAYEMGTAISDRLIHLSVVADPKDWVENYAMVNNLHPAVIAFVKTQPQHFENSELAMKNEKLIATSPRSWEKVSQVMNAINDRLTRQLIINGILGQEVASEFMIVAEDISATVQVMDMIKAKREERLKMVPTKMHGLNAMVFGLVGMVSNDTIIPIMEILSDLSDPDNLFRIRNKEDSAVFKKMPIRELATFGMEQVFSKALKDKTIVKTMLASPVYREYTARREKDGL